MASRAPARIIVLGLILCAAGAGAYVLWRPGPAVPVVGVVRTTEIRVAPEVRSARTTQWGPIREHDVVLKVRS
jgi:hypothetical protein